MDDKQNDSGLLLSDLFIENFRGIKKLSIPRLGRVTLLAGRNGVGKSTVLDALRVYAARGRQQELAHILSSRDEVIEFRDRDGPNDVEFDWMSIFHGRGLTEELYVSIGPKDKSDQLRIESTLTDLESTALAQLPATFSGLISGNRVQTLTAEFRGHSFSFVPYGSRSRVYAGEKLPLSLKFESLGPGLLPPSDIARMWDDVALTADEELITKSIELIYGEGIERVAVVGGNSRSKSGSGRRAIVKLKGNAGPIPLRSLGEGALRLLGVALALANSRRGFLLIDEAENGIHYSVQLDYWRMVLQSAHENKAQVFATTHSWDCISAFARAASEDDNAEGVLVRLDKTGDHLQAVEYSEEDMETAASQGIEMR